MGVTTPSRRFIAAAVSAAVIGSGGIALAQPAGATPGVAVGDVKSRSTNFNDGWSFVLGDPAGAQEQRFNDSSWQPVTVPHDWSIHKDFEPGGATPSDEGLLPAGVGWYRKSFTVPKNMAGKQVSLDFDGVMGVTTVYLNGKQIGTHNYGYTSFSLDLSRDLLTDGRPNVLAVKVSNIKPNSRWYTGSGIYRDVALTVTDPIHVARHGTFVTTPTLETDVPKGRTNVAVKTTIENDSATRKNVVVQTLVVDNAGGTVASATTSPFALGGSGSQTVDQKIPVERPKLWSTEQPNLYTVISKVKVDGRVVDTYETGTGFRSFRFDEQGSYLNGKPFVLRGMNMHHDLGALGAAVDRSAVARQLRILKDAGVNAIRLSHNPASEVLIEEADKMGIVLIEEAFDQWRVAKRANDYSQFFATDAKQDIQEMVNRDKNSPAVVMWSIGNEIPVDTSSAATRAQAVQDAKDLNALVKEIDTTRPTTWGEVADPRRTDDPWMGMRNAVDIPGVNYADRAFLKRVYDTHPNHVVMQTEASWGYRSRGYYYNPKGLIGKYADLADPVNGIGTYPDSWQASSYDNEFALGGSLMATSTSLGHVNEDSRVLGSFLWSGFDYFGETSPYADVTARTNANGELEQPKNSYSGMVDTAGFPKDLYYLYQSQWTSKPMVHLLPDWNAATGETVTVWAYTNADTVKLSLNGKPIAEKSFQTKTGPRGTYRTTADGKLYLDWDVPFQAGTLKAEAYRNGKLVDTDTVTTAGPAAKLKLNPEQRTVNGGELAFIDADVLDAKGTLVPDADNRITFEVTGGQIVGVDNGNPISLERYADSNVRRAFSGKALVIVKPDGSGHPIKVRAVATAADGKKIAATAEVLAKR
jgi:beta-galactosidase